MIGDELREPHQKKPRASVWARLRGNQARLALGAGIKRAMTVRRRRSGALRQPSESTHAMITAQKALRAGRWLRPGRKGTPLDLGNAPENDVMAVT